MLFVGGEKLFELDKTDLLIIIQTLANMMILLGVALLLPSLIAHYSNETIFFQTFVTTALITIIIGILAKKLIKPKKALMKHAIISIALGWFLFGAISAIPFLFLGLNPIDAFFESISGLTGTGITIIPNLEVLPSSILFWRGLIQWLGGFGIVVMALLIYEKPETAMNLFSAEGRNEDFFPNIKKIARMIVAIYFLYTFIGIILYLISGMNLFDATIHSFTSIATGGFSTKNNGIGFFGFGAAIVTIILTVLGGISFESHYSLLTGKFKKFIKNPELKFFFLIVIIATILIFINTYFSNENTYFESFFYVISSLTSTGTIFGLDLSTLPALTIFIIIILMAIGASYGSTSGGLKLWRILILYQVVKREIHRAFLPQKAVTPIMLGGKIVSEEKALKALSYISLYLAFILAGSIIFMYAGFGLIDSIFTVVSAIGNNGLLTISQKSILLMEPPLKILLTLIMIVGRMEIVPFLVLLKSTGIGSKIR